MRVARIHYEVDGKGPPLLLHHGFAYCLECWRDLGYVDALKHEFTLILIDARGHGASQKHHDSGSYSLQRMAGDVLTVLDELDIDRTHYFGYSLGGRVGYAMAEAAQERLASLIVCGAAPNQSDPRIVREWANAVEAGMPAFVEWWRQFDSIPRPIESRVLANDPEALRSLLDGLAIEPGLEDVLPKLHVPSLFMAGDLDPQHDRVRRAAESASNATFVSLPALSHGHSFYRADVAVPYVREFLTKGTINV